MSSAVTSALKPPPPPPSHHLKPFSFSSSHFFSFYNSLGRFPSFRLVRATALASRLFYSVKAQTLDFSGTFCEGEFGSEGDPDSTTGLSSSGMTAVEEREQPPCPPGLRQYETMAVLRPDMSEDERLGLSPEVRGVACRGWWDVHGGLQPWRDSSCLLHQEEEQGWRDEHLFGWYLPPLHLFHQARVDGDVRGCLKERQTM